MADELRDGLAEDLRRFRLKGRPGFRDEELTHLSSLQTVQRRAVSGSKNAIDDAIDALVEEAIVEAVGTGKQGMAIRLHLEYDSIPGELVAAIAESRGIDASELAIRHKERNEAAALVFPYSIDHYVDSVLPEVTAKMIDYLAALERGGAEAPSDRHFYHVRDILRAVDLAGDEIIGTQVTLSGLVTRRVKQKRILFFDLADGSGTIQLMAVSAEESLWRRAQTFQVRSRIAIRGQLIRSSTGQLSVELTDIADHRSDSHEACEGELPAPTEVYLARLEGHFRGEISAQGFTEISTRQISSSWPSDGVDVLRILYDGYGCEPFYLTPSPIPQLIRRLIDLPYERVFSVSRCFTPTYRDPHVSSEAVILAGAASDLSIVQVLELCNELALALYESDETAPVGQRREQLTVRPEVPWSENHQVHTAVTSPEIQVFGYAEESSGAPGVQIARLCWPYEGPDEYFQADYAEYILGEGYSEMAEEESSLTCFVLNIERLLALLLEGCNIRRIPALAVPSHDA